MSHSLLMSNYHQGYYQIYKNARTAKWDMCMIGMIEPLSFISDVVNWLKQRHTVDAHGNLFRASIH